MQEVLVTMDFATILGKFMGLVINWLNDEDSEMGETESLRIAIEDLQIEVRELTGSLHQTSPDGMIELVVWECSCGNMVEAFAGHRSKAGRKLLRCAMCSRPMRPEHIM